MVYDYFLTLKSRVFGSEIEKDDAIGTKKAYEAIWKGEGRREV